MPRMEALAIWRAFQFDYISFRVGDIYGGAFSLCAVARGDRANLDSLCLQLVANARFVERLYPKTDVIHVARFLSWRCAAGAAEFAIHGYEINE